MSHPRTEIRDYRVATRPVVHSDGSKSWDTGVPERAFEALWQEARPHKEAMVCVARDGTILTKLPNGSLQCCREEWHVVRELEGGHLRVQVVRNKLHVGAFTCYDSLLEEYIAVTRKHSEKGLVLLKKLYPSEEGENTVVREVYSVAERGHFERRKRV